MRTILYLTAFFILAIDIAGCFFHPAYETTAGQLHTGIPGYDYAVLPKKAVWNFLEEQQDTTDPNFPYKATHAVANGLFHTENRRISLFENWIMWLAGKFYEPLSHTLNSKLIISGGAGNCTDRTQVLMDIYKHCGLGSRIIALNGHVSMEVFFKGSWRITDPDFDLVFNGGIDSINSIEGNHFTDSVLSKKGFSKQHLYL